MEKLVIRICVYITLLIITIVGTILNYKICGKKTAILVLIIELVNIAIYTIGLILVDRFIYLI